MDTKYLSAAETAKLIRQALKESFPGVKFGVRSHTYAGGASAHITYIDGPKKKDVAAVTDIFEGAYFDGMIDYKGYKRHTLDGEPVRFGADFIFVDRYYSDDVVRAAVTKVAGDYGIELEGDPVELYRNGKLWGLGDLPNCGFARLVDEKLGAAGGPEPQDSATVNRVDFYGDDGYGQGTVGMPHDRDTGKGYPRGDV